MSHSRGPVWVRTDRADIARPGTGRITGGIWYERRRINRETSVPDAWDRLHEAGNFHNLELAAGRADGASVSRFPFLDSDVYKWLEACGWVFADPELEADLREQLLARLADTMELLEAVQESDGYINSNFQVKTPGRRWEHLTWGHELYCLGHLIQAGIALRRTTGDDRLFEMAVRAADLVYATFADVAGSRRGIPGHPEIETALVELYRETGDRRYLDVATAFIEARGHGSLAPTMPRFGSVYWQDHEPVRRVANVDGHAVRQLYLLAGAADAATERDDPLLIEACTRLWDSMVAQKTYITGGVGAHYMDEAFGDPYELPSERAFSETCAAIASIMFSHRLLLATGDAKYGDLVERTLYNAFLSGLGLDGRTYLYTNPLQVRDGHVDRQSDDDYLRTPWFECACCPPNVMRLLASLEHYVVAAKGDEMWLSQYVTGEFAAAGLSLAVTTDYPWDGHIRVEVTRASSRATALKLRMPDWATDPLVRVNGEHLGETDSGWWTAVRPWAVGDLIEVDLPMAARFSWADPRVDSLRGSVALERGPLVYCIEGADNPQVGFDDVVVSADCPVAESTGEGILAGVPVLRLSGGKRRTDRAGAWPYGPRRCEVVDADASTLTAIPYLLWGNRVRGSMRVWLPTM